MRIDLNADVGEGLDAVDALLLPLVTSANIACGGHAGDDASMARTMALAVEHGVTLGAHPGYPDREGFGRRRLSMAPGTLGEEVAAQVSRLEALARSAGATVRHVKPHGALYHAASEEAEVASALAAAVHAVLPSAILVGPAGSRLLEAGRHLGHPGAREGFADRAYEADGSLRPRTLPGAVHDDPKLVVEQAVAIAREQRAPLEQGGWVSVEADTLCLHGDSPNVVESARAVRHALAAAGVVVAPLPDRQR